MGPYDTRNWARLIRLVKTGKLPGVPPSRNSFAHVSEVVGAHLAAAATAPTGAQYLLGGTDASYMELVQTILEIAGGKAPRRPTPLWLLRGLGQLNEWISYLTGEEPALTPEGAILIGRGAICDSSRAMAELGYQAVPLERMVRDSVEWLESEGLLAG